MTVDELDVVVLLGSSWEGLEHFSTRWREVILRWSQAPEVAQLTVVDLPHVSLRAASAAAPMTSWLPGVSCVGVGVRMDMRRALPSDALALRRSGRALAAALPAARAPRRIVVSASPTSNLLARLIAPHSWGFDAFDDWRARAEWKPYAGRFELGYRSAADAATRSTNTTTMRERLHRDHGLDYLVVGNGVDLSAYDQVRSAPEGLPPGPFAVYLGNVEGRVDLDLLLQTQSRLQVVVAGPIDDGRRELLEQAGVVCLGRISTDLVPGLLSAATIGLVPHVRGPLTASMDPMKVREYLAAGLPVVSTDVQGVGFAGVLVADSDSWVGSVEAALRAPRARPPGLADWDDVAAELLAIHSARVS